jgi:hypothetical protein
MTNYDIFEASIINLKGWLFISVEELFINQKPFSIMKKVKLNLSFGRYTDDGLQAKAQSIILALTGNANFPNPLPPLATLQAELATYSAALAAAATNDVVKIAEKNEARLALEEVLVQLGLHVMAVSNGDIVMLTSSGFDLPKDKESAILEQPGSVSISNGITTGELVVKIPRVQGAYSYLFLITPDPMLPNSVWETVPSSRSSNTFQNLVPGIKYWIKIAAVGSGSQIAYTPAGSQIAQ